MSKYRSPLRSQIPGFMSFLKPAIYTYGLLSFYTHTIYSIYILKFPGCMPYIWYEKKSSPECVLTGVK